MERKSFDEVEPAGAATPTYLLTDVILRSATDRRRSDLEEPIVDSSSRLVPRLLTDSAHRYPERLRAGVTGQVTASQALLMAVC